MTLIPGPVQAVLDTFKAGPGISLLLLGTAVESHSGKRLVKSSIGEGVRLYKL